MLSVTRIDEANFDSSDQDFLPRTMFNNHARYDHCLSLPVSNVALPVDDAAALPEFTASGATGIFKAPIRAAVHPSRPPVLELRPHPLRETQVGRFLRTIGCTETQLWAGQESGVRFWRIKDAYQPGCGLGGRIRRGDEDAVPFYESGDTSPTLCMEVDHGNRFVWTGHKDGSIRSWKMDVDLSDESTLFKEGLSWSAHKGPVLALVISSYGDIWSGSEGGVIKIWPWETVEKSLSMSTEEARISSLLVERGFIDLRSQVTVNGVCNISSSDIKAILSDHARARVWCATSLSFSLWDARTKELIKVFNMDGQIENRADMPGPQDQVLHPQEDEAKVKFVSQPSKKEKSHNSFLQRSRNAIIGAAGAVRRVASRGASSFNEESKKTETMVLTSDGTIWSGCSNGLLIQWDSNGNRVHDFNHHPQAVLCLCTYGSKLWVGYASGVVQLLDLDGNIIAGWVAHTSPVIKMAVGGGYVFSMAIHGGIRGWQITSPGPVDNILRMELAAKEEMYTRHESFKILVGTWNVGQGKPPHEGLKSWLGSTVSDVGIVVVGLQEVDMGAGFLAMSAAKETVGMEGSGIGQLWQDAIGRVLDEGLVFERVGSRQLAGLLIAIWVKKNLRPYVGDLDVAAVACGFGRTIGNKGGVGLRLRVHDRIICFVNCHLAAHLEAVNRRNADFDHIFRTMVFSRQTNLMNVAAGMRCLLLYCSLAFSLYLFWLLYTSGFPLVLSLAAGATSASQVLRAVNGETGSSEEGRSDLSQADMVIFCGDFNYRLFGITYDEARDLVSQRSFDWLREKDQLRAEMKAGKVFQGMHEAEFGFPPTYKFDKYKPGLGGYDSGEKKRIPAWCDRVIYRDCRNGPVTECNLSCPIISSVHMYEACMDVTDSDHKPVRCKLNVRLARVDRSIRRKEFGEIMNNNDQLRTLLRELSSVPETSISTDEIVLQNQDTCTLCISNKSQMDKASIRIVCEGQRTVNGDENSSGFRPRGSFGFPPWLEINPACGLINPEQSIEISVHHADDIQTSGDSDEGVPQNRCEDSRDKEVILSLQVRGCYSIEAKTHQIQVRHCYSGQSVSRTNSSGMGRNGSSHHRHDSNSNVGGRG